MEFIDEEGRPRGGHLHPDRGPDRERHELPERSADALAELASSVIEDPEQVSSISPSFALAAEDPAAAKRWIEIARKDSDLEADATHLLGRIHDFANERTGDDRRVAAGPRARCHGARPGPSTITDDELEAIATDTLEEPPEKVREYLAKVPILIDTLPSAELVADGLDPRLLGLFQGTPMPDDGNGVPAVTNILLFKTNLERASADAEQLADEIRITVIHETAHYFGFDEADLEAIGLD